MNFTTFESWEKNTSVNTLVFNNDRLVKAPEGIYGLLGIPRLLFKDTSLPAASAYKTVIQGLNYSKTLSFSVPSMVVYKTILFKPATKHTYTCIYEPGNPFISPATEKSAYVSAFIELLIGICESEFQKLHRIALEIKKKATYIDFYISYQLIEYLDILLSHTLYYTLFLQDLHAFAVHTEMPTAPFQKVYDTMKESLGLLNTVLEQTRHGTMQRISYLDSGTARILTIVATIFLPTAFLVSLVSMPLRGAPLRDKKNGYWMVVVILLAIFTFLIGIFYRDFVALFRPA